MSRFRGLRGTGFQPVSSSCGTRVENPCHERRLGVAGLLLFLVMALTGCARSNQPELLQNTRPDWGPTYRLSDGVYELHVLPEIGRVMHFSRVGEPNLFWNNPHPVTIKPNEWANFGGDKLWPWPQDPKAGGWGWPPPVEIDRGPYFWDYPACVNHRWIDWNGPPAHYADRQGSRTTVFKDSGVATQYTIERPPLSSVESGTPVAAWSIVQIPVVDAVYVRLIEPNAAPTSMNEKPKPVRFERVNDRWLKFPGDYTGTKIGVAGDLLAARVGDRVFVMQRTAGNDDPDLEKPVAAQIYFAGAPKTGIDATTYTELELIGPTKSLATDQFATLETTWKILTPREFDRVLAE